MQNLRGNLHVGADIGHDLSAGNFQSRGLQRPLQTWFDSHPQFGQVVDLSRYQPMSSNVGLGGASTMRPPTLKDASAPGEWGKPFTIARDNLSSEQQKLFDEGWKRNSFNQFASDIISVRRTLPDIRKSECTMLSYPTGLPDTSVIITFHNEAWSTLLRSIYSILDRSPPELVHEIILVDDASELPHLGEPLERYVAGLDKIRILRTYRRLGLVRARLLGASHARGSVLTFLDSHIECTPGWLEPILNRIAQKRTNVVCPVIDVISDQTLEYKWEQGAEVQVGGFDWGLQFTWHPPPAQEKNRTGSIVGPLRSPTMAGGLFSIAREYFEYLGAYDEGMDIWGGENLEFSFRIWMCGGSLEILPCSHVGHIFRFKSPYTFRENSNEIIKKNLVRLAEVWMDEFKQHYYERIGNNIGNFGDIEERKKLRRDLQCKTFSWYLNEIYPELFVPGKALASGDIECRAAPMCVDSSVDKASIGTKAVILYPCHKQGGNQIWFLSKSGEIRRDEVCLDYSGKGIVLLYFCHSQGGNQKWEYTPKNQIFHPVSQLCLSMAISKTS